MLYHWCDDLLTMLTHNLLVRASTAWSQWITRLNYTLLRDDGLQERRAFHIINLRFVRKESWSSRLHAPLLIRIHCSTTSSFLLLVLKYTGTVYAGSCCCFHVDTIISLSVMFSYRSEWGLTILGNNQVKCSNLTRTRLASIMKVTPSFAIFTLAILWSSWFLIYVLVTRPALGRSGCRYHYRKRFFVGSFWPFLMLIFFTSFKIIMLCWITIVSIINDSRSVYFHHLIFLTFIFLVMLFAWFLFSLGKLELIILKFLLIS